MSSRGKRELPAGLFAHLLDRVLAGSRHRHAERCLAGLGFAESSFLPVPTDLLLIPMTLATPSRACRLATIASVASVVGGFYGYAIGHFGFRFVTPLIEWLGQGARFELVLVWFEHWGFWAVLVACFSPIPYASFAIGAGMLGLGIVPFALASLVGRGARFFLEVQLVACAAPRLASGLLGHVERIGWATVTLFVVALLWVWNAPGSNS